MIQPPASFLPVLILLLLALFVGAAILVVSGSDPAAVPQAPEPPSEQADPLRMRRTASSRKVPAIATA